MQRPSGVGAFEFVILASLRAVQLTRGCRARVEGIHKFTVTAQLEVSEGKVMQEFAPPPDVTEVAAIRPGLSNGRMTAALLVV